MARFDSLVGKTYHVRTFGCQMNLHDSERVAGLLDDCGCIQVMGPEEADIVVFMTCSVREKADTHLYGEASNLVRLPAAPSGRRILAVGGCIAQRDGEALRKHIPNVDVVFGTSALAELPRLLEDAICGDGSSVAVDTVEEGRGFSADLPSHRAQSFHAWVPIMVGCNNYYTMGSQLDRLGYFGKMYHNNDYTYYDRNITHECLGYSEGFMGYGNGMEEFVTFQWPESDLEMIEGTLPEYIDEPRFNIYYMTVSGHNGYTPGTNAMTDKHWEQAQDLPYESDDVKGYIACNLELEDAMTALVDALEEKGIADDTVICLTADHFPYGLDDGAALGDMPLLEELYGYPVENYFERDHNRLIIWSGCLEDEAPIVVEDPVSCVDILPTLSNLFGLEFESRLMPGRDVFSDTEPLVWTLLGRPAWAPISPRRTPLPRPARTR